MIQEYAPDPDANVAPETKKQRWVWFQDQWRPYNFISLLGNPLVQQVGNAFEIDRFRKDFAITATDSITIRPTTRPNIKK